MTTFTLWYGSKNFIGSSEYETVEVIGEELGKVRFTIDGDDVQYHIFRTENDRIIIHFVERRGYDCLGEVYEYADLNEAKTYYAFILRKAGVI